ncbi:MAG: hypothetical protein AB7O96_18165, partial [Pseudobdellovibrionaceae bacterium]
EGISVPDGATVEAFSSQQATSGNSCADYRLERYCQNGVLSGSSLYSYRTCSEAATISGTSDSDDEEDDDNCSFGGITVPEGQSVTAYSRTTVPNGDSCSNYRIQRRCDDGDLTGSNAYAYRTCTQATSEASCAYAGCNVPTGPVYHNFASSRKSACESAIVNRFGSLVEACTIGGGCGSCGEPSSTCATANPTVYGACVYQ